MNDFLLVVEGESDRKFLKDLIIYRFARTLDDKDFILLGGNETTIESKAKLLNSRRGLNLYFILDTDSDLSQKRKNTNEIIKESKISVTDLFFLPNNSDAGNLENLLFSIIPEKNKDFFQCLENFKDCVLKLKQSELRTFDDKDLMYMYQDSFSEGKEAKETKRSYLTNTIWNLNSPALDPLIQFLKNVLK
jgi:hypothetical protein